MHFKAHFLTYTYKNRGVNISFTPLRYHFKMMFFLLLQIRTDGFS